MLLFSIIEEFSRFLQNYLYSDVKGAFKKHKHYVMVVQNTFIVQIDYLIVF